MNIDQWLKLTEILVGIATPVAVVLMGALVNKSIKRMESDRAIVFKKKELRKEVYEDISEKLNIIICYVADVGDFGEYTPEQIVNQKRYVDRKFKSYEYLWSNETIQLYDQFIKVCFKHFSGGPGTPAKIRSKAYQKRIYFKNTGRPWEDSWNDCFTDEKNNHSLEKYQELSKSFIAEFVD